MNELPQGSVILVDVSYSGQAGSKLRPALVVSNTANNQTSRDIVVAKITSKKPKFWGVRLNNEDLAAGSLDYVSYVQVDALYSLEKVIVHNVIGMVCPEKIQEIKEQIADLLVFNRKE
ncbi:MAG: type II toxin-antitoxin system PemK/MazF family toxin [Methanomicrobiales archaeon]